MQMKHLSLAAGLLLASAGAASAAPAVVSNYLNLRSGPGTGYRVVDVMPAGATVDVLGCGTYWCRVAYGDTQGYASSSYLGLGSTIYAEAPPPVAPALPLLGFGFGRDHDWNRGWGDGWRGGWGGGWGDDDD